MINTHIGRGLLLSGSCVSKYLNAKSVMITREQRAVEEASYDKEPSALLRHTDANRAWRNTLSCSVWTGRFHVLSHLADDDYLFLISLSDC